MSQTGGQQSILDKWGSRDSVNPFLFNSLCSDVKAGISLS